MSARAWSMPTPSAAASTGADFTELAGPPLEEPLAPGRVFCERYRLVHKLGEGGMGVVWLAEQFTPVERPVALKLIRAGAIDACVVQRFHAERRSLALMDHAAIAKVFDAGAAAQGQPYLVMEYVPGVSITAYCDQHRLSIAARLELFIQACEGVQHAHQKAIIHRDLKPANILVLEQDGRPRPRIIDFGLAMPAAAAAEDATRFTQFGQFIGTPGFMSPEQVDPSIDDVDTRSDVYSLGVILYVLLTGLQPFETAERRRPPVDEWLRRLRDEEPPRPSNKVSGDRGTSSVTAAARATSPLHLASALRGDLDWITMKALERDRARRYGTASELAADLRRYLAHEAVLARPASARYRIAKFVRRHRLGAGIAALVMASAALAAGAGLLAVRRQHEAQYQATQTLRAQSRLLTQTAGQRLRDGDVAGGQGIILAVLTDPAFAAAPQPAAISVFQDARAADAGLAVFAGHDDHVYSAAYSPDGLGIVTGSNDATARLWDARTGAELGVLRGHRGPVFAAAYSPDGRRIVTASADQTARIWDAATRTALVTLAGHADSVNSAAYSPDGARIVTTSDDHSVRIWDARSGLPLAVLDGHTDRVSGAVWSPDGRRIASASDDKTVRLWDAASGATLAVLAGHAGYVYTAAFSPDGRQLVSASDDKTVRLWDVATGAELAAYPHQDRIYSAAFSPDGTRIVTASLDKTATIWDARSGARLRVLSGHGSFVYSAAYSPDGLSIVTASADKTARLWDARVGAELASLAGHGGYVYSAAYSPDGTRIVTASDDKTARIWDARTHAQLGVIAAGGGYFFAAAFAPDGARIVTGSDDKTARIWDARTARELTVLRGHAGYVYAAAFSPDGRRVVTASDDRTARIWDAAGGRELAVLQGHGDLVIAAAYSPDGSRIVTASLDKTARIWDARSGKALTVLEGHGDRLTSAAYSPDGTRIVTGSLDKTARIWDAGTGALLAVLAGHTDRVSSVAYSPDGALIVTASFDKTARIWNARSAEQLAVLAGHGDRVKSAAFSPDGTRIVTASLDRTAKIWDARVPANLAAQIAWDAAALADPLAAVDRNLLGLEDDSASAGVASNASACDRAAGAVYDPDRKAPGVSRIADIDRSVAGPACLDAVSARWHPARVDFERARSLAAAGDRGAARARLEVALERGYRAAAIDLGDLLLADAGAAEAGAAHADAAHADAAVADTAVAAARAQVERAIALYEKAWADGIPIAATRLAEFYEHGGRASTPTGDAVAPRAATAPDRTLAWFWYRNAADAGEPNALARLAARVELGLSPVRPGHEQYTELLRAFELYASAAARARAAGWPDADWQQWRYRRASLARVLAAGGKMREVAAAYTAALANPRAP
jgi:WD40 repeat protein